MNELSLTFPYTKIAREYAPNKAGGNTQWARKRVSEALREPVFATVNEALRVAGNPIIRPPIFCLAVRVFSGQSKFYDEDAIAATFKPFNDHIAEALGLDLGTRGQGDGHAMFRFPTPIQLKASKIHTLHYFIYYDLQAGDLAECYRRSGLHAVWLQNHYGAEESFLSALKAAA